MVPRIGKSVARQRLLGAAFAVAILVFVLSAVAVATGTSEAKTSFTLNAGRPVGTQLLSEQDRQFLDVSGATEQIYLIGRSGERSYFRIVGSGGGPCYGVGSGSNSVGFVSIGCLHSDEAMPTALVDMSGVVMDPLDGSVRLERVEGIASDQAQEVGLERPDGSRVVLPIADNVYRFAPEAIPTDTVAIVALDESGAVIERKLIR
jgi:hypothetical protein